MFKCKYCGKGFIKLTSYAAHMSNCKLNPNLNRIYDHEKISSNVKDAAKNRREKNPYVFKIIDFSIKCQKCGKEFIVKCSQRDYDRGKHKKFCSTFCSHSRIQTEKTKNKIKKSIKHFNILNKKAKNAKYDKCVICGKEFELKAYLRKNGKLIYSHSKTCSKECHSKLLSIKNKEANNGGYREGSFCSKYKYGKYKSIKCDSSWELAFVVWNIEHGQQIKRCQEIRKYILNGIERKFYPDFLVNDKDIYEIKGIINEESNAKQEFNKDVKFLYAKEMKPYLDYCINKYGKNFTEVLYEK